MPDTYEPQPLSVLWRSIAKMPDGTILVGPLVRQPVLIPKVDLELRALGILKGAHMEPVLVCLKGGKFP